MDLSEVSYCINISIQINRFQVKRFSYKNKSILTTGWLLNQLPIAGTENVSVFYSYNEKEDISSEYLFNICLRFHIHVFNWWPEYLHQNQSSCLTVWNYTNMWNIILIFLINNPSSQNYDPIHLLFTPSMYVICHTPFTPYQAVLF